jgi:hypothetical protein
MSASLTTQAEAVIYYIQEMDIDMVDLILDKDITLQDLPKQDFMDKLNHVMEQFRQHKNTRLQSYPGFCSSDRCPNACSGGQVFVGNRSGHYMNLIFDVKMGNVSDLYECEDFQVLSTSVILDEYLRIHIDDYPSSSFGKGDADFDIF